MKNFSKIKKKTTNKSKRLLKIIKKTTLLSKPKFKKKFHSTYLFIDNFKLNIKDVLSKPSTYLSHIAMLGLMLFVCFAGAVFEKNTRLGVSYAQTGEQIQQEGQVLGVKTETKLADSLIQKESISETRISNGADIEDPEAVKIVEEVPIAGFQEDYIEPKETSSLPLATTTDDFLIKPAICITEIPERNREGMINYTVENSDTLSSIALQFKLHTNTIRWANNLEDVNLVKPGQVLTILPMDGICHWVSEGETLQGIVDKYEADINKIIEYNELEDGKICVGQCLMVPDGKMYEVEPEPEPESSNTSLASSSGSTSTGYSYPRASYGTSRFPYGYCTWYVASRRNVGWMGNAGDWLYNARSAGYSTGYSPSAGSIMVTAESGWGHVAYVESIGNGTVTVSEMNYAGWGVVNSRTLSTSAGVIRGYIY